MFGLKKQVRYCTSRTRRRAVGIVTGLRSFWTCLLIFLKLVKLILSTRVFATRFSAMYTTRVSDMAESNQI